MARTSDTVYHRLQGTYKRSTEKALCFNIQMIAGVPVAEPKDQWVPRSQVKSSVRSTKIDDVEYDEIEVAEWFLKKSEWM